MNCDDVFDVLTRGPFPTGEAEDHDVETHLAQCRSCRELAEALRPAVELIRESVAPEECAALPGYHGAALVQSGIALEDNVRRRTQSARRRTTPAAAHWLNNDVARIAAAVLLGLSVAIFWRAATDSRGAPWSLAGLVGGDDGESRPGELTVAAAAVPNPVSFSLADLPPTCRPPEGPSDGIADDDVWAGMRLASLEGVSVACCTECHAAGASRGLPKRSTETVARACRACH